MDSVLSEYVERSDIVGFGVGIIFHNRIIFSKGYGFRDLNTRKAVTPRSLFHMASVSKLFVATAIMQLAEQRRIDLEDKIVDKLPYFRLADPRYREITVGQMLSHLSGMPDVNDYEWNQPQYDEGSLERYVRSLWNEKLISDPGKEFHYSNMAYDILADVIAKVSGLSFEEYTASNILEPIGMISSTFLKSGVPDSLSTSPHVYDFERYRMDVSSIYPYNRPHAGSSTLHSNIEDMIRWAYFNLNRGHYNGKKILSDTVYKILWKKKHQIGGNRFIGLSWFISDYHGKTVLSHGGGDTGFRSYLLLIPEDSTAVVTMGNSDNFQSFGIVKRMLDILYEFPKDTLKAPASAAFLSIWGSHGLDSAYRYFSNLKELRDPYVDFDDGSLIMLAWPLFDQGNPETALQLLELNSRLFPESIWNHQFKAEVLYHLGRKEEAVQVLKDALEIDPLDTYTLSLLQKYRS